MRNIWTIASREYKHYFISPSAYLAAFAILFVLGLIFFWQLWAAVVTQQQFPPGMDSIYNLLVFFLLFFTPAITMRSLAEEQRMGTIELLLTAPIRDWELVVGKWLGGFLFLCTIVAVTWVYPLVLNQLVDPGIDQGPLLSSYLGMVLICASLVAIGVAVSSLFDNQFAALFASWGVIVVLLIISFPAQNLGSLGGPLFRYLDFGDHFYNSLFIGIIDLCDVIYYVSLTVLALFLGSLSVESRRWR